MPVSLTWGLLVSISRTPRMRPAKSLSLLACASVFLVAAGFRACAKAPAPESTAAAASPQAAAGAQDTTLPAGVDISKLDDFQKKVFFRIANSETSICGQAQSLIQSAKAAKDPCRRSLNALRY